ncbi:MAG TPA: 4'-phosphopantetheinyl transferase superfamily protein [Candidatus Competibacteraceae bacterium]|nr:4'-phosphopantetheinyl transferase superfamily protein [Candidatus Competibacteraceae bacterium]
MIDHQHLILEPAPALAADEAHLWLASLQPPVERLAALAATLTVDERERAMRFRFPEHRDRFIAGRGLLRELLGAYLDQPAAFIRFSHGPRGKPTLTDQRINKLHFNLSHSSDRVLYAIARREVGVDVETLDRRLDYAAVAERICASREWAAFQGVSPEQTREMFFACWTRKEAVAKAIGDGLATGLSKLDLCFQDSNWLMQRARLVDASNREWSVLNVPIEPGWTAALAAPGVDWHWRGWRWNIL